MIFIRFITTLSIAFLTYIFNRKKYPFNLRQIALLTYSGIPRGILAFALGSSLKHGKESEEFIPHIGVIRSTIMAIVILSTIFVGGITPFI